MSNSYLPTYIKSQNRKVVFDLFRKHGQLTRAAISNMTGISLPTVMKIVDFLLSRGIVAESAEAPEGGAPGRRGKLLQFNPEACRAIGFIFEGQYACIGLVNMSGELIEQHAINVLWRDGLPDLAEAGELIASITGRNLKSSLLGVGIGFPGIIDPKTASILQYNNIGLTSRRPFAELFPAFARTVAMPFYLENDVNLACVGEIFRRRQDGNVNDLVYLSLGTGLGGGIVLDGNLRRGASRRTGEVGNIQVELPGGATPRKLESLVNLHGIQQRFGVDIHRAGLLDEARRMEIAAYISGPLGMLMANMANTLDVADFVLAGVVPEVLGDVLYRRLNAQLQSLQCPNVQVSPPLNPCPGITGGAITVFDNMIFDVLGGD